MQTHGMRTVGLAAMLALGAGATAAAQSSGDGYLFHAPQGSFTIRAGYDHASAGSDVFAQAVDQLTISKRDFSGLTIGGDVAFAIGKRFELALDAGWSHARKRSEFRKFIDNKNLPIEQNTTFDRVPLSANLRYYLAPAGRSIGALAWIPTKVVPWIGAGGGMIHYNFRQDGDFVNFNTGNVFPSTIESSDWTPMLQGMGGADFTLTPRVALRADARYVWAKADLNSSFQNFNPIDLSGVQGTLGFTYRL
jgi:hypothetical protein